MANAAAAAAQPQMSWSDTTFVTQQPNLPLDSDLYSAGNGSAPTAARSGSASGGSGGGGGGGRPGRAGCSFPPA